MAERAWWVACAMAASVLIILPVQPAGLAAEAQAQWIKQAAAFVVEATGSAVPQVAVRRVDAAQLAALFAAGGGLAEAKVAALYLPAHRRILVADDLDLSDPRDRSYLVHELVHAQQFASGRAARAPCLGRLEAEAYAIQARFLRAHGQFRDAFLNDLLGLLSGTCAQLDQPVTGRVRSAQPSRAR